MCPAHFFRRVSPSLHTAAYIPTHEEQNSRASGCSTAAVVVAASSGDRQSSLPHVDVAFSIFVRTTRMPPTPVTNFHRDERSIAVTIFLLWDPTAASIARKKHASGFSVMASTRR